MINRNDVVRLLALCAAHDQRTVGAEDVDLWHGVATLEGWSLQAAQRVIVERAARGADQARITPAAITDRIREVRRRAAETFELPRLPDDLADADYPAWLRTRRDAHVDALVTAWAATGAEPPGQLPPGPRPNEIGRRRIAELTAGAFKAIPGPGAPSRAEVDAAEARSAALARPCPYCEARPHEPCTRSSATGRVRIAHPHPARTPSRPAEEAS